MKRRFILVNCLLLRLYSASSDIKMHRYINLFYYNFLKNCVFAGS